MPSETIIPTLFSNAREELMQRVVFRDKHLRNYLISLATIFALANGIKIHSGLSNEGEYFKFIYLCLFSFPISLMYFTLYYKEENLIGHISNYIKELNDSHNAKTPNDQIVFWDSSKQLQSNLKESLNYRTISVVMAFIGSPILLSYFFFNLTLTTQFVVVSWWVTSSICTAYMAINVHREYWSRRKASLPIFTLKMSTPATIESKTCLLIQAANVVQKEQAFRTNEDTVIKIDGSSRIFLKGPVELQPKP